MTEKLVPRVEVIENPRKQLEYLKKSNCSLRLFLKEGDKTRYGTDCPLDEHRILRVYAETIYDSLSSSSNQMITESRKERGLSYLSVGIVPAHENQTLTFFLPLRDLEGKQIKKNIPIFYFGFDKEGGDLSLGRRIDYRFYTSINCLKEKDKRNFDKFGKEFNLNEFGWYY